MDYNKYNNLLIVAALILINIIIYFNGIKNEFIWDDKPLIRDNYDIRDVSNLKKILTSEDSVPNFPGTGFYRPMTNLTFMLDYHIHGGSAAGYRFTNIVLHILCSVILFYLTILLTKNRLLSFTAALIFSAQAVHVEAVTFISSRNNVLCALFILLSLYCYIKNKQTKRNSLLVYSLLFLFLGAASKEFAFLVPVIFIIYDYSYDEDFSFKKNTVKYAAAFSTVAFFLIIKSTVTPLASSFAIETKTLFNRRLTTLPIMVEYIYSQVLPVNLALNYELPLKESFFDFTVIGSLLLLLTSAFFVIKYRKKERLIFFTFFTYFILLLPVSNIAKQQSTTMSDRWLYPASFALAILLSRLILLTLQKRERFVPAFVILFTVFLSFFTMERNHIFKDDFTLFSDSVKKNPTSATIRNNIGLAYQEMGDLKEAERHYRAAIKYRPDFFISYNKLGLIYGMRNDWNMALKIFMQAYSLNPRYPLTSHNIAASYHALGNYKESIKYYKNAIALNPKLYFSYFCLSEAYYDQNKFKESIDVLNKIIKSSPDENDRKKAEDNIKKIIAKMNNLK